MTTFFEPSCALKPDATTDLRTRYAKELVGELRCFDRVILHGTLIDVAHPGALLVSMQRAGFRPRDLTRFAQPITGQVRDHISRHLTDGAIDLALIKYDSEDSAESRASGLGPCIHHFGIEVDDMNTSAAELAKYGCEIISAPGVIPIKFRAPGGTVAEISPKARYKQAKD